MKKIVFEIILFSVSFLFMQGSVKGHDYFLLPILLIAASIMGLIKYKNQRHASFLVMAFISSVLTLANSRLLADNAPAGINRLIMLFCLVLVFGSGLLSFVYIHMHSLKEQKKKFKPKNQQDATEKIDHYLTIGKQILKLWKTRKETNIGFLHQLESLFEKKEEEKNAVTFILGTEVDQDTDSYKYE